MPANLYRRGAVWWARIKVRGKQYRRSLRTTVRSEAVKRLEAFKKEVEHFRFYGENRVSWKRACLEWNEKAVEALKPAVVKRYLVSIKQLRPVLDDLYVDQIDARTVAKAANRKGVTNATLRRDLTAMSSVLTYCISQSWRADNPVKAWDRGVIRERRDQISPPEDADVARVLALCPGNFRLAVELLRNTGMRQEEAFSLEWPQVRGDEITLTKTKTSRPRTIKLATKGGDAGDTIGRTVPRVRCAYVFWHKEGEEGATRYHNVASRFREIVKRAERQAKKEGAEFRPFRCHDLRHGFAIRWLRNGGDIYALSRHLGHTSVKTTEMYLGFVGDTNGDTVAAVSEAGGDA